MMKTLSVYVRPADGGDTRCIAVYPVDVIGPLPISVTRLPFLGPLHILVSIEDSAASAKREAAHLAKETE